MTAAEQVTPRTGLDGAVLPARLPATAAVFAAGRTGLRHVEVIAGLRYDRFRLTVVDHLASASFKREDELWSPRAGLVVKPVAPVSLYVSYSRSFLPQSGDQFLTLVPPHDAIFGLQHPRNRDDRNDQDDHGKRIVDHIVLSLMQI